MQILKEEIRQAILDAALFEFLDNGYKNASLRKIAKKANITVGTIYCYFKNKEYLYHALIDPVIKEIEISILENTNNQIDWNFNEKYFLDQNIKLVIDFKEISRSLIEIKKKYNQQMQIIVKEEKYKNLYKNWLSSVLYVYFIQNKPQQSVSYIRIISSIASVTLIDAVIEIFQYHKECMDLNIDESEIVYQCFKAIMQTEESKL